MISDSRQHYSHYSIAEDHVVRLGISMYSVDYTAGSTTSIAASSKDCSSEVVDVHGLHSTS